MRGLLRSRRCRRGHRPWRRHAASTATANSATTATAEAAAVTAAAAVTETTDAAATKRLAWRQSSRTSFMHFFCSRAALKSRCCGSGKGRPIAERLRQLYAKSFVAALR